MIKGALIEAITADILKQSRTQDSLKQAHPKDIEYQVSLAYSSMLKQFYTDARNLMATDFDYYAKKYTLTIASDTDIPSMRYVTLTALPFELQDGMGVRSVRPIGGVYSFDRTTEDAIETYRSLDALGSGDASYYKDGDKLMLIYARDKMKMITQVVVKLIPHFEDFLMTENIEFPMGEAEAVKVILQLMGIRPTDNTSDDVR